MDKTAKPVKKKSSYFRFFVLLLLALSAAGLTLLTFVWRDLQDRYLEASPPILTLLEVPRGVGLAPVLLRLQAVDSGAGLDEIVVRAQQRKTTRELLRQNLSGKHEAEIRIDFNAEVEKFDEGILDLTVRCFDRSFFSNAAETNISLKVDYHRPHLEVLSAMHNGRHGGSQLLFYKAQDEDLGLSGVKVGSQTFLGFPARGIDPSFTDKSIFAAVYGIDLRRKLADLPLKAFAEDQVGNGNSVGFNNHNQSRTQRSIIQNLRDDFLDKTALPLCEKSVARLRSHPLASSLGLNRLASDQQDPRGCLQFLNEVVRRFDEDELVGQLGSSRFESFWKESFLPPRGSISSSFGDKISYRWKGEEVGSSVNNGYEVISTSSDRDVTAANDGIVVLSEDLGLYGKTIAIDHGFGLVTIYSRLSESIVKRGQEVSRGQRIGQMGISGLARNLGYFYEMRVQGVPVDGLEWWDQGWFFAHISSKITEVKRTLGLSAQLQGDFFAGN